MIIAIPFVPQRADFTQLAASINEFAGLKSHILVITSPVTLVEEATEFFNLIKNQFAKAFFKKLDDIPESGFSLANRHFAAAAKWASEYNAGPGETFEPPFFYLDPAYHPTQYNWADQLQSIYYKSGGKVIGQTVAIPDTTITLTGGGEHTLEGGKKFDGPVVLDHGFAKRSTLLGYLRPEIIWRDSLRWEMLQSHTETEIFQGSIFKFQNPADLKPQPKKLAEAVPEPAAPPIVESMQEEIVKEDNGWQDPGAAAAPVKRGSTVKFTAK